MAGTGFVIVGIRIRGESRLRWIDVVDNSLKPGDQVTVDGVDASVVVGSEQIQGSLNPEHLTNVTVKRIDPAELEPRETQADELDRILATFPRLGSDWISDTISGMVVSINVRDRTASIKDSISGETVVITHAFEGE